MRLSVIVPVYNSQATLGECLSAILKSDYKEYELIVVDDNSSDNSLAIAQKFPCRIVRFAVNCGPAAVRNRGAQEAKNEVLLFVDSDIIVKRDSLSKVVSRLREDKKLSGVAGVYSLYNPFPNFLSQYKHMVACYREEMCRDVNHDSFKTAFLAVKKDIFNDHKFDESLTSIEDIEFGRKLIALGYKFFLDKTNDVEHFRKFSVKAFFKNQYFRSQDIIRVNLKRGAHKFYYSKQRKNNYAKFYCLRVPLAWLAAACLLSVLLTHNYLFLWGIFLSAAIAVFIEKGFLKFCLRQKGVIFIFQCIMVYFADGIISGLGVLRGIGRDYLLGGA